MPTLGTQNISTSYPQLLKTFTTGGIDGTLQVITDGDNTSSALSLSTTGVKSTGTLAVDGTSLLSGIVTFGTSLTASTGTATIGTLSASTATISTATISTATISTATIGTIQHGTGGPKLTTVSFGTAAFSSATAPQYNAAGTTTGTFALNGASMGDIVIGTINSLGSATGTVLLTTDFHMVSTGVVRYNVANQGATNGTIPAGTIFATALRYTA